MAIRIVVCACNEDGEPDEQDKKVFSCVEDSFVIGSPKECEVRIPTGSPVSISISRKSDSTYAFHKDIADLPIAINGEPIDESGTIKSGDSMRIGNHLVRFTVEFERAKQNRKIGWISYISTILIVTILVLETGVIVVLPQQVAKRKLWGLEVMKQRTTELLDLARSQCERLSQNSNADLNPELIYLIEQELDSIAVYLRKFMGELNMEQVADSYQGIQHFQEILNDLEKGDLLPELETINASDYIKTMIEELDRSNE